MYSYKEKIIEKGDEAEEMFILYSGEVGVYVDNECKNPLAVISENKVFGETALEKGG
jgi:CRP-like cAMP-binding protein